MAEYTPIPEYDPYDVDVHNDNRFDDANTTGAFDPFLSSTPAPEFQTEQKEKGGLHEPPAFLEDLSELPGLSTTTLTAENEIFKEFPNADKTKIKYKMDSKGRTEVGLIAPKKPFYRLLTEIPGESGKYQINPRLPKEFSRALGEGRRQTIQQEIGRLSEGIIENKKMQKTQQKTRQKEIKLVKGHKCKFHPG